jgi:hypothetical protein
MPSDAWDLSLQNSYPEILRSYGLVSLQYIVSCVSTGGTSPTGSTHVP